MAAVPPRGRGAGPRGLACVVVAVASSVLAAEDAPSPYTTTVTATRTPEDVRTSAASVTVLQREDLEVRQLRTVVDALRTVPGVDVVQSGGPGALTSVFVRGTDVGQTLVLLDGVILNDPSDFGGGVDLADVGTESIERIEILRGPASSLYGSSAVGGVINIVTRTGHGPLSASATFEGGSLETFRQAATVSGRVDAVRFALTASHLSSAGIAVADPREGAGPTNPYARTQLTARLSGTVTPWLEAGTALNFVQSRLSYDAFRDGRPAFDPNLEQRERQLLAHPWLRATLLGGRWTQDLSAGFVRTESRNDDGADLADPSSSASRYVGRRWMADWLHTVEAWTGNRVLTILSFRNEAASGRFRSSSSAGDFETELRPVDVTTVSAALQDEQRLLDAVQLRASVRIDHHAIFGSAGTYTLAGSWVLPGLGTVVHASYGTAFTAPSLQQLDDPTYGNPALRPERSRSAEAGLEQPIPRTPVRFGATGFRTDVDQLFGFDPSTFRSINVGAARITGLESFVELRIGWARARLDHTWMHPLDRETGRDLVRRPRHKLAGILDLLPRGRWSASARVSWVGRRDDTDYALPVPGPVSLPSYTLVSLAGSLTLVPGVTLGARIENALDRRFSQVLGYGSPGFAASGSLEVRL